MSVKQHTTCNLINIALNVKTYQKRPDGKKDGLRLEPLLAEY